MTTLTCPRCHQRLTVSELAPRQLTCPNCLARLINPRWGEDPKPSKSLSEDVRPRKVISLDRQVHRDMRSSIFVLAGTAAVFAAGAVISFKLPHGAKIGTILAVLAILAVATIVAQLRFDPDEPAGEVAANVGEALALVAGGCLKIGLIVLGLIALLLGSCAIMVLGSGKWHGS